MSQRNGNEVHLDLKRKCIDYLKMLLLLKHLHDWGLAPVELKGEKSERHGMVNIITNSGNCDDINDADSDVKVAARYTGSAMHSYGPVFAHSLCTVGGRLFWGIDFFPNVTRVELAEELANRIVKRMEYLFDP